MKFFLRLYKKIIMALALPVILSEFFAKETGKEYNVGFFSKLKLFFLMARNNYKITSASSFVEHLIMAKDILKIPKNIEGVIVEAGTYKGGSAANLSLVCGLCSRKLSIFDSFEGLPEPNIEDKKHVVSIRNEIHSYEKGSFGGTLEEVKKNISDFGRIDVCDFYKGFFNKTLPGFNKKIAFAFLDVDLRESLETCLKYFWPLLQNNSFVYFHEAIHSEMCALFFDKDWWQKSFNSQPPGIIGAGTGLGLFPASNGFRSSLAYTIKNPSFSKYKVLPQR